MQMVPRKWEDMNMDCLVNILGRLEMKMLLQDIPFVCKSWYKASRIPQCWTHLHFPVFKFKDSPRRLVTKFQPKIAHSIAKCVKFAVRRSNGSATYLHLPNGCPKEALRYAGTKCPNVTTVVLPTRKPLDHSKAIPPLITNWKNLEILVLSNCELNIKEIAAQIGTHCKNFIISLGAPGVVIEDDDAAAIATHLPKLKRLALEKSNITKEGMFKILKGCKELEVFMARYCIRFQEDDAEILLLAAHIPTFNPTGSLTSPTLEDFTRMMLS